METKKTNKKNTELQKEHFKIIGERLRELRKDSKISILQLEEELNLASGTVHNLEAGKGANGISFIAIVSYFHQKGYSYKWILDLNKDSDFKKDNDPLLLGFDKPLLKQFTSELKEKTNKILDVLGKYVEVEKL